MLSRPHLPFCFLFFLLWKCKIGHFDEINLAVLLKKVTPSHISVCFNDGVRSRLLETSFKNV